MTETQLQPSETAAPPAMGRETSFIPAIWNRATGIAGRRGFLIAFLVIGALLPLIDRNEGDIDAGANALEPMFLSLSMTTGGAPYDGWAGVPTGATPSPSVMDVAYVRVFSS